MPPPPMPISIVNAQFLSLNTLSANGHRYRHDVTAAAQVRNRTTSHFMQCIPFFATAGRGLAVRQVDTNTAGRPTSRAFPPRTTFGCHR